MVYMIAVERCNREPFTGLFGVNECTGDISLIEIATVAFSMNWWDNWLDEGTRR